MTKVINVVYKVNSAELERLKKELKLSEEQSKKLEGSLTKAGDKGAQSFLNFKNIVNTISFTALIGGLTMVAKRIFDLGAAQQQTNVAFETFLGSAEKARKVIADLTKFSIVTPFTPDQVFKSAKTLLAFGLEAEKLIPTLKFLGDVSSGTGKDLTEMAVIFGQIRSTGRLMGQDLLQLINAGFNPLQVISKETGRSVADLKKDMEKGLITFDMVEQAFRDATTEGGLFFNLMEKQSATVSGKLSTIQGNIDEVAKSVFFANEGPISDTIGKVADLTSNVEALSKAVNLSFQVFGMVSLITPFADAISFLSDKYNEWADRTERLNREQLKLEQSILYSDIQSGVLSAAKVREAQMRILEIGKLLGENAGTTEDPLPWATGTEGTKTATNIAEISKEFKRLLEEMGKLRDPEMADISGMFESQLFSDSVVKLLEENSNEILDNIDYQYDQEFQKLQDKNERELEEIRLHNERKRALQEAFTDFAIDSAQRILTSLLTTNQVSFDDEAAKYDERIRLAGDNERARQEIELQREEAEKAFRQRQREEEKKQALRRIAIDTAANIIRSILNNGGIPFGLPFGALAAAAGIVQAATVRKFKKGAISIDGPGTGTSDSIPAMISRGESVINADATSRSKNLLEAINDRKLDDRVLYKIAASGGSQFNFDDKGIIAAIEKNKVDYARQGYSLMEIRELQRGFKQVIRSKTIN